MGVWEKIDKKPKVYQMEPQTFREKGKRIG
jgi:hypothetical protein